MKKMDYFTFDRTYYEALRELPDEQVKEILMAMSAYVFDGEEPELSGLSKGIFEFIRPTLDAEMQSQSVSKEC